MKSPLLVLASCFALGILATRGLSSSHAGAAWLLAALCVPGGLVFLRRGWRRVSGGFALAGFVLAGVAAAGAFQNRFPPNHIHNLASWGFDLRQRAEMEGVIASVPIRSGPGITFDLACRKIAEVGKERSVEGKVQLRMFIPPDRESWAALDALDLHYGEAIRAPVRFERPTVYGNPGNFDFRWWMEAIEDISWEGTIRSPLAIEKISGFRASKFSMLVEDTRARLLRGIDGLYPPWSREGRVGAVLKAVLLGDRSSLDSDTVENFRQSGLYHLLVISGLHVGLLAAVVLFFLNLFHLNESWRALFLLAFLAAYALLVEQRAPTLRASLMIGAYLLGRYLYRDRGALNAVGLAGLVLLVYRPAWLFEAGFQLSFSAALLIAGLAIPILERTTLPYRRGLSGLDNVERDGGFPPRVAQFRLDVRSGIRWLKARVAFFDRHPALAEHGVTLPTRMGLWMLDLILLSAVIQVGLLMPMAATFHRITVVGIGLNGLALPLMTVLIALAVPTVILSATLPAVAIFPGKLLLGVTNALLALTEFHHIPSWLSYRIPGPAIWVEVSFALALIAVAWSLGRNKRALAVSLAAFMLFTSVVITYPFPARIPKGRLEVTALDCGRGEALFTVLPDGTTLLMDAGGRETYGPDTGRWNPGEEIVSPYLWSRGIQKIDILALSNGSDENIRAIEAILRNFKVRELWRGPRVPSPAYQDLVETARERGVAIRELAAGDQESRGETEIRALWPPLVSGNAPSSFDADSLAIRIASKEGSIFLRGDTDDRVARTFADSPDFPASTVLESARSVSGSASKFLERVNPKIVVISGERHEGRAGSSSPVGEEFHPANVEILRTAADGAVTVDAEPSHLVFRCYGKRQKFN
jgi:competence protein ComEC